MAKTPGRGGYLIKEEEDIAILKPREQSKKELKDYKIFSFDGEPRLIEVDFDRFTNHQRNLYTPDWKFIPATIEFQNNPFKIIQRPQHLDRLLDLSRKLSKNMAHVRTDFYIVDEKIYFGELTLYHGSGFEKFLPASFEKYLSSLLRIPYKAGV